MMRAAAVAAALIGAALTSSCSAVGGGVPTAHVLNPSKVYIGFGEEVWTTRREAGQYACLNEQPMVCMANGHALHCRCPF